MRINNNITALNTLRQYSTNTSNTNKSMEKLSSGLRINRAGDDAAGLAISEKMRAQIRGIDMASKNSQDAISLVQTAEGALTETHSILQRMNELAVQSSSDTNDTTVDRAALQQEFEQLKSEINDIASQTKFNGKALLDGTFGGNTAAATGLSADLSVTAGATASAGTINIATVADWDAGTATAGTGSTTNATTMTNLTSLAAAGTVADGAAFNGTYYIKATGDALGTMEFTLVDSVSGDTVATSSTTSAAADSDNTIDFGDYGNVTFHLADIGTVDNVKAAFTGATGGASYTIAGGEDAEATATIGDQAVTQGDTSITLDTGVTMNISNLTDADWASQDALNTALFGSVDGSATVTVTEGQSLTIQTGSSQGETLSISISAMNCQTLGLTDSVQIDSLEEAESAISTIESAINTVSSQRAGLGAYQNRLEHKINNLSTSSENLSAAESRIRDVDMAEEMVEYTKNNILLQAAQSMLAQANAQPQGVLQLLQ